MNDKRLRSLAKKASGLSKKEWKRLSDEARDAWRKFVDTPTPPAGYVRALVSFDDMPWALPGYVRRDGHGVEWGRWAWWNGWENPLFNRESTSDPLFVETMRLMFPPKDSGTIHFTTTPDGHAELVDLDNPEPIFADVDVNGVLYMDGAGALAWGLREMYSETR